MTDNDTRSDATATGLHSQADYPTGTVLAGRFRIESILGIGGMGVVYRATDLDLDVPVALKLLRPELAHRADAFERFRQELLLARQVSSAHVVRIHDLARHEGRWLISMDYIQGQSLDQRIDRDGPLAIDDTLHIARQIAEGLAAAHAKGVVHRDLKPANILLDTQGNAYISDFGVARSLATSGQTRTGSVVGTPDYLAPEQARGEPADARSDLYSLGLILYEMLTGQTPFAGGTVAEVLAQRMLRTPDSVSSHRAELPSWVVRLVDRLLRAKPAHRFQSASEVVAAIDQRTVPRRLYADVIGPHRNAWLGLAAVVLLGAGIAGWWGFGPHVPAIVASPPLNRLLVQPIRAGDIPAARVAALSGHLRDALAAIPGYAVVGEERTAQALQQLDPEGTARVDVGALRRIAVAQRLLQPALVVDHGRWRVRATIDVADQPTLSISGAPASDPIAALRSWIVQPETIQALGLQGKPVALALPASYDALDHYGAGLLALRRNQLDQALHEFASATSTTSDYPAAWLAEAETALMIGEQDKAADAIEQGQRAAARAPDVVRRRFAAQRAVIDGDLPTAVEQWRGLSAMTPDDTDIQLDLARARGAGGDYVTAIAELKTLTQRDGNDPRAWFELGKFSILSGDAQHAVDDDLVRALVQFKRSRNLYGEAETVNALGIGYDRLGQTRDAAEQYRKAVVLRHAVGNRRGEATSLRNLANALSMTGAFDEAAGNLDKARALHAQLGDRAGLAAVENELGLLAEERGNFTGALQAFQRALKGWQAVGDPLGSAQALNDIGFAQFELGDYNDAQVYLQQASGEYARLGDQTGQIRIEQDLGVLDIARGRWNQARQRLLHSLASAGRQQMIEEAAVSRRHLAELELQQGHLQAAIEQSGKAADSFRGRDDPRGQSDAGLLQVDALLAAHADGQAQQVLSALQPAVAKASAEQRAIAQLLQAELAQRANSPHKASQALRAASQVATGSGIRELHLRIALEGARMGGTLAPALDEATASLGHVELRLQWLQLAMQQALAAHDPARAASLYNEAANLLRAGDSIHAAALHALGAAARNGVGDAAGARAAQARADEARSRVRSLVPKALQAVFDAAETVGAPARGTR
ncbi:MAG: tetratricopeptide repeat family protein [Xanthomonadaceae bacterium]|nr:tetratricopeptide repeat family protein [Xanthomonadaceae bacterium]